MCLRLLYLVPLIGITGTSYALADPITPLHVEPDQIQEERLPGEFRETPEDAKQTEAPPAPEEPPSSDTPSTIMEADPQAAKLAPQDVLEELAHLRKALLLEPDQTAPHACASLMRCTS